MYVLKLNQSTLPQGWITVQEACKQYALGNVLFEIGEVKHTLLGGINQTGRQSAIAVSSIIGCRGKVVQPSGKLPLCNHWLFVRDNYRCLYCGKSFSEKQLTLDHIMPRSRGGKKTWTNSATACKRCNTAKGARTPEEAGMPLLAVPFKPNLYEQLFLRNHRIISEQAVYLSHQFSAGRRWLPAKGAA